MYAIIEHITTLLYNYIGLWERNYYGYGGLVDETLVWTMEIHIRLLRILVIAECSMPLKSILTHALVLKIFILLLEYAFQ